MLHCIIVAMTEQRTTPQNARLTIAVIERDRERALMIVDDLAADGAYDVKVLGDETGLARKLAVLNPDIVLIDVEDPSRDLLEELTLATGPLQRPVAMFVDRSDAGLTRAAIEAGLSAYVVDGLRKDRIVPILEAAIARFHLTARIRSELATTKAALAERKSIDRAKGILMRTRGLTEDEAYSLLRKTAMDQGRKIAELADALVAAAELMK